MNTGKRSVQSERSTLVIGPDDVLQSVDIEGVIDAVEDAFVAYHDGTAKMPPKSYVDPDDINGDFRSMPAVVGDAAGIKWVNVHPDNPKEYDLPTVMGVVVHSDPKTGYPLAIIDGTTLTRLRTGAAAGAATRHLAPDDARSLGLLGAGRQAHTQVAAISAVIDLDSIVVSDIDDEAVEVFVENESDRDVEIRGGSPEDVAGCDVVSTTTPVREPILMRDWIEDDTHINAMGADAKGKQELESAIVEDGHVVVDDWEQCSHSGEINVPVESGLLAENDIHANLGEIVTGAMPGARRDITVFDSTGLAIQDVATAQLVYESADEQELGTEFQLVRD